MAIKQMTGGYQIIDLENTSIGSSYSALPAGVWDKVRHALDDRKQIQFVNLFISSGSQSYPVLMPILTDAGTRVDFQVPYFSTNGSWMQITIANDNRIKYSVFRAQPYSATMAAELTAKSK